TYLALAWGPARRIGGIGFGILRRGTLRRLLGVQPESLGYGGRRFAGYRGGGYDDALRWNPFSPEQRGDPGHEWLDRERASRLLPRYVCRTQNPAGSYPRGICCAAKLSP